MIDNRQKLEAALALALADVKFMGNNDKVEKAVEALTPKSTVTATFKRLQGNAKSDFLVRKDAGQTDYTDLNRDSKIKEYVYDKFKSYMVDTKTRDEATKLFDAAYTDVASQTADSVPAEGIADLEEQAA